MKKTEVGYWFDEDRHIGGLGDEIWPSSTQCLTAAGFQDFSRAPAGRVERKRLIGLRVHAASVMIDNGTPFNNPFPETVPYLDAYHKWRVYEKYETILKEHRLFSQKFKFHGQFDELAVNDKGELCIIDYKCLYKLYPSTGAQLASYEILIRENAEELNLSNFKSYRRFGLLLKENGNYDMVEFDSPRDFEGFHVARYVWWARVNTYKTLNPRKDV